MYNTLSHSFECVYYNVHLYLTIGNKEIFPLHFFALHCAGEFLRQSEFKIPLNVQHKHLTECHNSKFDNSRCSNTFLCHHDAKYDFLYQSMTESELAADFKKHDKHNLISIHRISFFKDMYNGS